MSLRNDGSVAVRSCSFRQQVPEGHAGQRSQDKGDQ
jgi:hypothetical protein